MFNINLLCHPLQILAVAGLFQPCGKSEQLLPINKLRVVSNLLDAANLSILPLFYHAHKGRGLIERGEGSGIEPGDASVEDPDFEFLPLQIDPD